MPYPKQFLKLSFSFTVDNSDEVADTALSISTPLSAPFDAAAALSAWTLTDLTTLATSYNSAVTASGTGFNWAVYSNLVAVKLAAVGVDGHYLTGPKIQAGLGYQGTVASVPPQNTVVLSLWSGLTFGRANYGRMYLPHTTLQFTTGGYGCSSTVANTIATAFKSLFTDITSIANGHTATAGPVIMSSVGTGTVNTVNRLRVGNLVDTQRRRRNRLNEVYSTVTL